MDIVIKKLTLYKNIVPSFDGEKFFKCDVIVLNPQKIEDETLLLENIIFLQDGNAVIEEGKYLFTQMSVKEEFQNKTNTLKIETIDIIKKAAAEIYLESLWQQLSLTSNQIYIRKLEEHSSPVIQLFWKI
jgi:uncharacterized protein YrzB (UPF0473 family)